MSACATCDGFFFRGKKVAVVGGGDTALEEATFLTRFATDVQMILRRDQFRGSKIMQQRAVDNPKISVRLNKEVVDVLGDEVVNGIRLRDTVTGEESELAADGLFLAIGYKPNTDVFRDWLEVDDQGYLVVHDETHSKVDGVFIAGDVHDHRYRQAVTAAGDGCKAAIDAERWLESQGMQRRRQPPRRGDDRRHDRRPRHRAGTPAGPGSRDAWDWCRPPRTSCERWLDEALPASGALRRSTPAAAA